MKPELSVVKNRGEVGVVNEIGRLRGGVSVSDQSRAAELGTYHEILLDGEGKSLSFELVESDGLVLGIFVATEDGQCVFLPRAPEVDILELVQAINRVMRDKTLEVVEGNVTTRVGKSRRAISQLGVLDSSPKKGKPREVVYDVPASFRPSKLATAARYDTDEKRTWRTALLDCAENIFGSADKIPPNERYVLCFPGLGQEAYMWRSFGFKNEEMIFVEKDPQLAEELAETFAGAKVLCMPFQSGKAVYKQVKARMGKNGKLSILSVDPNNQWSRAFFKGFQRFIDQPLISNNSLVSMCFSSGRGEDVEWWKEIMKEVIAEDANKRGRMPNGSYASVEDMMRRVSSEDIVLPPMSLDDLRMQVVEHALAYTLKSCSLGGDLAPGGYYKQKLLNKGRYRGDGTNYMYFAMHHVTKK